MRQEAQDITFKTRNKILQCYGWCWLFHELIKNDTQNYDNITKIGTGQRDDSTTGSLPVYRYFKEIYKVIAKYLSKQEALDADSKPKQQIKVIGNVNRVGSATIFFHYHRINITGG